VNELLTLAATRPAVAWLLGYTPFLALIAALVALQSGWRQALVVAALNGALASVPVACVWAVSELLAWRRGTRSWWADRLGAVAGGLVPLFVLALAAIWAFDVAAATGWGALLVAGLLTVANVVPLALGVGIEAAVLRFTASRPAA
jgi:hypothetical protein